jgi:hypothetical protein
VVIDLGEAHVLVGEKAQRFDGRRNAGRTRSDTFEEIAQLLLVDDGPPGGLCLEVYQRQ